MLGTIFDFETTGLIKDFSMPSDSPEMPHIVQCAAKQVDLKTRKTVQAIDLIVFPSGWVITPEVVEIHGIDNHTAARLGHPEQAVADLLFKMQDASDIIIAHNANFDKRIARSAYIRYFGRDRADYIKNKFAKQKTICTMNKSIKAVGVGRYPSLAKTYKHFTGEDLVDAHNAMADVEACERVFWCLVDQGIVSLDDVPVDARRAEEPPAEETVAVDELF
jgi:DNA polymerase III epsilon subunit-like protein